MSNSIYTIYTVCDHTWVEQDNMCECVCVSMCVQRRWECVCVVKYRVCHVDFLIG